MVTLCGSQLEVTGDARTYALFFPPAAAKKDGRTYARNRSVGLSGTAALGVNFMVVWVQRVLRFMDSEDNPLATKARQLFGKNGKILLYQLSIYHHVARVYSRKKGMTRARPSRRDALVRTVKACVAVGETFRQLCDTWWVSSSRATLFFTPPRYLPFVTPPIVRVLTFCSAACCLRALTQKKIGAGRSPAAFELERFEFKGQGRGGGNILTDEPVQMSGNVLDDCKECLAAMLETAVRCRVGFVLNPIPVAEVKEAVSVATTELIPRLEESLKVKRGRRTDGRGKPLGFDVEKDVVMVIKQLVGHTNSGKGGGEGKGNRVW